MLLAPHEFWQKIYPAGTFDTRPEAGFRDLYPTELPDGRQIALPIRVLPEGDRAVASLIVNQASFAVEDALVGAMSQLARPFAPEIVVGVPTLGLPLANGVARQLGHPRMVALGTSRKYWYRDELSEPISSITSPSHGKRIFLDPRTLPLTEGRRVVIVDDVISSGASMTAVLRLLAHVGVQPCALIFAMAQGERWNAALSEFDPRLETLVFSALSSPLLRPAPHGNWQPV
jgi:adenine/guanine phosphoribosyltransferase-like PRPP-binding protein